MRHAHTMAVLGISATLLVGCATSGGQSTEVTVLAAASLSDSFTEIGGLFEELNPGVTIVMSFGPSSGLVSQVIEGAQADVIATANASTMAQAQDAGVVGQPRIFATNALAIAVPAGNPAGITDILGLADPGVLIAVCEPRVPCGEAAQQVITASGLAIEPVTYEIDVKAVLSKVIVDEVDAGFVYATDVIAAGDDVRGVAIPADIGVSVAYPIAVVADASQADVARRFVDFVMSERAQQILAESGFGAP